ncbi:hypothetical protein FF1_019479 [Malus domestica]
MEKRKRFETAKIYVAYNFLMSFIGNDNVATALSITVMELECISEQDLKEAIVKGLGFQVEDLKVSGFDLRDTQMGHSVAYEFDVEVDNKVLPFKLLEDVDRWDYIDLPSFRVEDENGLVQKGKSSGGRFDWFLESHKQLKTAGSSRRTGQDKVADRGTRVVAIVAGHNKKEPTGGSNSSNMTSVNTITGYKTT